MDQKTDSKAFQLSFAGGVKYLSFLLVLHKNSIYICPHKLSISFGKLPGWANRPVVGCVLEKKRRIPVDVFLFSCLSSFHFKWTWTHSNEVKKDLWWMPQGLVVGVMSLGPAFSLGLRCSPSLWFTPSNSQAPAARKLPVFLRDFPHLLRVCIFSSSHSPPPASASMSLSHTHSYPGLISFFFCFFYLTHSGLLLTSGISGVSHSSCSSASCVVWSPFLTSVGVHATHHPLPQLLL